MTDNQDNLAWVERFNRLIDKNYSTKSHKKLWNYFLQLVRSSEFQKQITTWREKYNIPNNGFIDEHYQIPPANWELRHSKDSQELKDEIYVYCEKYELHGVDWGDAIEQILFYNSLEFEHDTNAHNLCYVCDIPEERKEPYSDFINKMDDSIFPIAIRISPYASNNEIVDYVRKNAEKIEEMQKPYRKPGTKIGRVKTKRKLERDGFISQNRDKSGKEIARLVKEKFGVSMPYDYVLKIKSREIKKRQKL